MPDELIYYEKFGVKITDHEAVFGDNVYAMPDITSVSVGNKSILPGVIITVIGLILLFSFFQSGIIELVTNPEVQTLFLRKYFTPSEYSPLSNILNILVDIIIRPLIGILLIGNGIVRIWVAKETSLIRLTSSSGKRDVEYFYNKDELFQVVEAINRAIIEN